jgi:hypothetical protein
MPAASLDTDLAEAVASFALDPLGFVRWAYSWPINGEMGPDVWQAEFLEAVGKRVRENRFDGETPCDPIRMGASTGHGPGKTALTAWLVHWIMSTRPDCRGTITANTNDQLRDKTWAAVQYWLKKCITAHWFTINGEIMYRNGSRESWACMPQSCAKENAEAFQGQHAKSSTSFYIFDEASGIDDAIYVAADGGLTDGEPMIFLWSQPTRNTGAFYRATFGNQAHRWDMRIIDTRNVKFSNKNEIQAHLDDYGEDSDYFRVRVRGLPPNADELQYIDAFRVASAQRNTIQPVFGDPLIAGVDVSGGGKAWSVCRFRRGFDARTIPPIRLTGEQTVANDRQMIITKLADALTVHRPDAMFIDSAFGAVVVSRLRQMGYTQVHEVNFGGPAADVHDANTRAFMWRSMKEWLPKGCIPQNDMRLETDLTGPGFHLNPKHQLVIESKESMQKRNVSSPDDGDALALTFAMPVRAKVESKPMARPTIRSSGQGWMQ